MKTQIVLLIILLHALHISISLSQNILPNPSFELEDSIKIWKFFEKPIDWNYIGTVDYYQNKVLNLPPHVNLNVPKNKMGYKAPKDGNKYVGIFLDPIFQLNNLIHCEYIYIKLPSEMQKGDIYYLEFYACLSNKYHYKTNSIGAYFSKTQIDNELKHIYYQKDCPFKAQISSDLKLKYPVFWEKISGKYEAKGGESFLYIGAFLNSDTLKNELYIKRIKECKQLSYIYLDNIYMAQLNKKSIDFNNIEITKKIEFSNVFFDHDKYALLPHSYPELSQLVDYLINNPDLKITIYGHTDNIGTTEYNNELSLKRAKSVANYLLQNNINSERIECVGLGATKPKTLNNTKEGRKENRRVEFKLTSL